MKPLILIAFLCLSAIFLMAQFTVYTTGTTATSLSAVTTTGAGTVFSVNPTQGSMYSKFTWQNVISGGTATTVSINLEGSLDNSTWGILDTSTSTSTEVRSVVNHPVKFVRCNLTSYTRNGTNETCQFLASN